MQRSTLCSNTGPFWIIAIVRIPLIDWFERVLPLLTTFNLQNLYKCNKWRCPFGGKILSECCPYSAVRTVPFITTLVANMVLGEEDVVS